jgi:hypothetical protein
MCAHQISPLGQLWRDDERRKVAETEKRRADRRRATLLKSQSQFCNKIVLTQLTNSLAGKYSTRMVSAHTYDDSAPILHRRVGLSRKRKHARYP